MSKKVLWLVTARSGSKSIPNKNIKPLGGIPLLAIRIKSALAFAEKEDVWISTDSNEYAGIAESYGATVPFLRPAELSVDTSKSEDAIIHAMEWAEKLGKKYDAIAVLEPTSPFITANQLLDSLQMLFNNSESNCIVAVRETRPSTFYIQPDNRFLDVIARNIAQKGILRRQDERKEITPSGGIYISRWNAFKEKRSFYTEKTLAYLVPDINGLEIDEPLDWLWAEFLLEKDIISLDSLFKVG